jgi:hypothetical protein
MGAGSVTLNLFYDRYLSARSVFVKKFFVWLYTHSSIHSFSPTIGIYLPLLLPKKRGFLITLFGYIVFWSFLRVMKIEYSIILC